MDIKVLLQAFRGDWLIEPTAADHFGLIAFQFLTGARVSFFDEEEKPKEYAFIVDASSGKRIGGIADAVDNGVAVLSLEGAVMKYDYCGAPGTQSLTKALQQANENPSVSAIVLQIDSPGGSVDGTQQFADAIKNSAKPVVAYVDGMMCSAAMWIGSAASQRISSSNTDIIGSIGTMAKWKNFDGYYKSKGIESHEVYATNSTHKNLPFREAEGRNADQKANYTPLIETWLDPMNNEFTGTIEQNLPDADKTVLNGSAYIAKDAKKKGLINKIGSFSDAVNTAAKLGKQKQNTQTSYSMKFPKLSALLKFKAEEKIEGSPLESHAETLEAVVSERDSFKTENDQLKLTVAEHENTIKAHDKTIETLTTDKNDLTAKVTKLEALDGGKTTATSEEKDKNPQPAGIKAEDMAFQQELFNKI